MVLAQNKSSVCDVTLNAQCYGALNLSTVSVMCLFCYRWLHWVGTRDAHTHVCVYKIERNFFIVKMKKKRPLIDSKPRQCAIPTVEKLRELKRNGGRLRS